MNVTLISYSTSESDVKSAGVPTLSVSSNAMSRQPTTSTFKGFSYCVKRGKCSGRDVRSLLLRGVESHSYVNER
jgi:hypothetical protein